MKALIASAYGEPEQLSLVELEVPRPGPGQIQVRIAAASLNPTDIRVVQGGFRDLVELEFPYVPGNDFAGTVTEVGADVSGYQVGDEVFGQAMPRQLAFVASPDRPSLSTGALAEYAVFEADTPLLAHRPATVAVEQAAALGIVGGASRAVMAAARIQPGERVLVIGATGGMGTTLVPLLARARAQIIATARTEVNAQALRDLGADQVIGYDESEYPGDVDVVLNLVLPGEQLAGPARSLRPGGRLITIVFPPPAPEQLGRDDVELLFVIDVEGTYSGMRQVAEDAESGLLEVVIAGRYPLEQGVEAAIAFAREHPMGKIVVTM